jgi:transporter family protein
MRPYLLALLAAAACGVGGYFEKRGLLLGRLPAQLGIAIRTGVALVILGALSFPQWRTLPQAGPRAMLYMILGGGVLAGSAGMLCFYSALKSAPLAHVMPLAFSAPLFGALMGMILGGEPVTTRAWMGMTLIVAGIALLMNR